MTGHSFPTPSDDDPRINGEYVRNVPADADGDQVILVGVLHDHPASRIRARTMTDTADPDVLALELAPVSIPLFEQYAADGRSPPEFGGEMSAAIQAASTDRVVGIDGPTVTFSKRLIETLYRENASLSTIRKSLRGLAGATRQAITCRVAAEVSERTGVRLEVDAPVEHECTLRDHPERQAEDERQQVRRAASVLSALGSSRTVRFRDETREAHMADRIDDLRTEGSVVAVVGIDHLDPLTERLRKRSWELSRDDISRD